MLVYRQNILVFVSVLIVGAALVSCDSPTIVFDIADSTYDLVMVNGGTLPATISQTKGSEVDIIGGSITFKDGGTFSSMSRVRITDNGAGREVRYEQAGRYAVSPNSIRLITDNDDRLEYDVLDDGAVLRTTARESSVESIGILIVYEFHRRH
jgi:hypothetical protein